MHMQYSVKWKLLVWAQCMCQQANIEAIKIVASHNHALLTYNRALLSYNRPLPTYIRAPLGYRLFFYKEVSWGSEIKHSLLIHKNIVFGSETFHMIFEVFWEMFVGEFADTSIENFKHAQTASENPIGRRENL